MEIFKDNRGMGPITVFFYLLTFYIGFFMFFGSWLAFWGHQTVILNNLTGVEAFFFDNIVIMPIVASIIFALAYGYIGGSQR